MPNRFTIEIDNISFEFLSMNVNKAQLFQVYVDVQGKRRRFHFKDDGNGHFIFALREDCPKEIVQYERRLSDRVLELYQNG